MREGGDGTVAKRSQKRVGLVPTQGEGISQQEEKEITDQEKARAMRRGKKSGMYKENRLKEDVVMRLGQDSAPKGEEKGRTTSERGGIFVQREKGSAKNTEETAVEKK